MTALLAYRWSRIGLHTVFVAGLCWAASLSLRASVAFVAMFGAGVLVGSNERSGQ